MASCAIAALLLRFQVNNFIGARPYARRAATASAALLTRGLSAPVCFSRGQGYLVAMTERLMPQDVVLALKLVLVRGTAWTEAEVAAALFVPEGEVFEGLRRLAACHLYNPVDRRVIRASLCEFLVHGVRYVFPASPGGRGYGIPTSLRGSSLGGSLVFDEDDYLVWPAEAGALRHGRVVARLHSNVPQAAASDGRLHEYLALVDALRVGRARERALASAELERVLAA